MLVSINEQAVSLLPCCWTASGVGSAVLPHLLHSGTRRFYTSRQACATLSKSGASAAPSSSASRSLSSLRLSLWGLCVVSAWAGSCGGMRYCTSSSASTRAEACYGERACLLCAGMHSRFHSACIPVNLIFPSAGLSWSRASLRCSL